MSWTSGREVAVATGGAASPSRTYTLTNGASVPVGNVLIVEGGTIGPLLASPFITDSKGLTWVVCANTDGGTGTQGVFVCAAFVGTALTNADTITLSFASAAAPTVVVRDFAPPTPSGRVALDGVASAGAFAAASWSSGASAALASADPLVIGSITYDAGTGAAAITPATLSPAWSATATASQLGPGSMQHAARWRSPAASAAVTFNGTVAPASDYAATVVAIQALPAPTPHTYSEARMRAVV